MSIRHRLVHPCPGGYGAARPTDALALRQGRERITGSARIAAVGRSVAGLACTVGHGRRALAPWRFALHRAGVCLAQVRVHADRHAPRVAAAMRGNAAVDFDAALLGSARVPQASRCADAPRTAPGHAEAGDVA